jgi:hypothetical protein
LDVQMDSSSTSRGRVVLPFRTMEVYRRTIPVVHVAPLIKANW